MKSRLYFTKGKKKRKNATFKSVQANIKSESVFLALYLWRHYNIVLITTAKNEKVQKTYEFIQYQPPYGL